MCARFCWSAIHHLLIVTLENVDRFSTFFQQVIRRKILYVGLYVTWQLVGYTRPIKLTYVVADFIFLYYKDGINKLIFGITKLAPCFVVCRCQEWRRTWRRVVNVAVRCRPWRTSCTNINTSWDSCVDVGLTNTVHRRSARRPTHITRSQSTAAGSSLLPTSSKNTA